MSRYDSYSSDAKEILLKIRELVHTSKRTEFTVEDLAQAFVITESPEMKEMLEKNGCALREEKVKKLKNVLQAKKKKGKPESPGSDWISGVTISTGLGSILNSAELLALGTEVKPVHLMYAAWGMAAKTVAEYLEKDGSSPDPVSIKLPELNPEPETKEVEVEDPLEWLKSIGEELTAESKGVNVFGRDKEVDELISILMKFHKPDALLFGVPGVGKTAVVRKLANRIKNRQVPEMLQNVRLYRIKSDDIHQDNCYIESYDQKIKNLFDALEKQPGIILYIDNISKYDQIMDDIRSVCLKKNIRLICATLLEYYHSYFKCDTDFQRIFYPLHIKELDIRETRQILLEKKPELENHYRISIPDETIGRAISLSKEFLPNRHFPDKAVRILDTACSKAVLHKKGVLSSNDICSAVADAAGVGFIEESGEFRVVLKNLKTKLKEEIIGQDEAVNAVCNVVSLSKQKMDLRPERPDGVFLFLGPTGTGKTALALSLAKNLTGNDSALIRIDMSEFTEEHTVFRLIGAPPGYIGYEDEPQLVSAVKECPSGILLLDEFEKAHPKVHRFFLQVFDAGRFTSQAGDTYSLANMTIVATSNIRDTEGFSVGFQTGADASENKRTEIPWDELKKVFPIELINRFDDIIPFNYLTPDACRKILENRIIDQANSMLQERFGKVLEYSGKAIDLMLEKGYSKEFGMRNMQRMFQEMVLLPVINKMNTGKKAGGSKSNIIKVKKKGDALGFD